MPICAQMISSWVRKVLGVAKVQMSSSSLQGAVVSAVFVASVFLVSILLAGDWARVFGPARHYFTLNHHYRLAPGFQTACCPWPQCELIGKCQILTYVKSCGYVRLLCHSSPQYLTYSFPIVCAVLALDS